MEIKVEKRVVEIETKIYIAEDGKEFSTQADCENYEKDIEDARLRAGAEKFEIKELDDTYPLDTDGQEIQENHCYKWYRVNNAEELNTVANLYNGDFGEFKTYPQTICVEYEYYHDEFRWIYSLSDMKKGTIDFWKKHGFDVEFKEV